MNERVLILWPPDRFTKVPWVGAGSDSDGTLSEAVRRVMEKVLDSRAPGEMHMVEDWWPMELCPIEHPANTYYCGCRPVFCGDQLVAVLVLWSKP